MIIFENNYEIKENTVITLGKFDGLHEGHRKLIEITVNEAKSRGYKSLLYTFNQNPVEVLYGKEVKQLISKEEKIREIEKMGIDYLVFQEFTEAFSEKTPEDFIDDVIKDKLKAKLIVVGFNYKFGRDAKGDIVLLRKYAVEKDFEIEVIEPVKKNGKIISSSEIRKELERCI